VSPQPKPCERCGTPFVRTVAQGYSLARFNRLRFCGKACSAAVRVEAGTFKRPRRGESLKCDGCGEGFYVSQSHARGRRFCSQSCYSDSLKTNRPLNCLHCGKEFYVSRSQEAQRNRGCCSTKCRARHERPKRSGKNCPFWRGGVSPKNRLIRESAEMKEWRKAVFERDNWTCQKCGARSAKGKSVHLHAHHVKQFAYHPELRFEVSNGVTLCRECHHGIGHERRRRTA
jgi:5-methylcytosine-specific restriction endonuclease McrA